MSYLPQEPSIFRNLSVKSNILGVAEKNFLENSDLEDFYQRTIRSLVLRLLKTQWVMCYQAVKEERLK